MWIIYGIRFTQPGHRFHGRIRYVGQTKQSLNKRWSGHRASATRGTRTALAAAMRKYGATAFRIEEIARAPTLSEANELEKRFISDLEVRVGGRKGGLNILIGGGAIDASDPVIRSKLRALVTSPDFKAKNQAAWARIRAALTPEQLSERARKASAQKGPEGRSAAALKAAATKRAKKSRS